MSDNPYSASTPPELYKLLRKDDTLTREQIDQIETAAFPKDVEIDYEDENVGKMMAAISEAKKKAQARADAETIKIREVTREEARKYLREMQVDDTQLDDSILDEIGAQMKAVNKNPFLEETECQILQQDDETMTLVTENGTIVAFIDAPRADADRRFILEWAGERLTKHQAREAGLQAEKDAWIKKINAQYDPAINKQKRAQTSLRFSYEPMGRAYLDEIRENALKAGAKELPKSVKIGLLTLAYTVDRAKVEVPEEDRAVAWLEANDFSEAVKVVKTVAKSLIPIGVKAQLTEDKKSEVGMYFYPGGVPQFSMK